MFTDGEQKHAPFAVSDKQYKEPSKGSVVDGVGVILGVLLGVLDGVFEGVLLADKVIHSVRPVCIAPEAFIPK
jgi:hypothetical protein